MTDFGVVVLSMGNRPVELERGLASLLQQREVTLDVLVVGNGWEPTGLPSGVRGHGLATNVGVPEGRNIGAAAVSGDVLLFFDDDLVLDDAGMLATVRDAFAADPALGVLQPRAVDPGGGATARRHVPRLRTADPERSGDVAWFWEGCSFVRRSAFERVGGWPGHFVYGHEGIELAWQLIDAGYRIRYAAELSVQNPPAEPFRAPRHQYFNARNRVWVARRNLPHPVLELYLLVWMVATFARARGRANALAAARGFLDGARQPAGGRRPISWRAVWRLTRLGRPPIV
ncbi:MAG TPA: glycosyltransferase [Mycobacteriales bacterium]|nr:glycosyltransferase [Mycobacteriales bacterium]